MAGNHEHIASLRLSSLSPIIRRPAGQLENRGPPCPLSLADQATERDFEKLKSVRHSLIDPTPVSVDEGGPSDSDGFCRLRSFVLRKFLVNKTILYTYTKIGQSSVLMPK
jgi:hypothetical protein